MDTKQNDTPLQQAMVGVAKGACDVFTTKQFVMDNTEYERAHDVLLLKLAVVEDWWFISSISQPDCEESKALVTAADIETAATHLAIEIAKRGLINIEEDCNSYAEHLASAQCYKIITIFLESALLDCDSGPRNKSQAFKDIAAHMFLSKQPGESVGRLWSNLLKTVLDRHGFLKPYPFEEVPDEIQ